MRCELFLAAWVAALVASAAVPDPWLEALYGRRRPQKKDVRMMQVANDFAGQAAQYDYADDSRDEALYRIGGIQPRGFLGKLFHRAYPDEYYDDKTTLFCITVRPRQQTTQSTTPETICFTPTRRPHSRRTSTTIRTPPAVKPNCEMKPLAAAHQHLSTATHGTHRHLTQPSSSTHAPTISTHKQSSPTTPKPSVTQKVEAQGCAISKDHEPHSTTHKHKTTTHRETTKTHVHTSTSHETHRPTTHTHSSTPLEVACTTHCHHQTHKPVLTPSSLAHVHPVSTPRTIPSMKSTARKTKVTRTTTTTKCPRTSHKASTPSSSTSRTTHEHTSPIREQVPVSRSEDHGRHKPTKKISHVGQCAAVVVRTRTPYEHAKTRKTVTSRSTYRVMTRLTTPHRSVRSTTRKPLPADQCLTGPFRPRPATRKSTARPKTRPPVDEFLAAWGFFRHHNSLNPKNGSHWREFHGPLGPIGGREQRGAGSGCERRGAGGGCEQRRAKKDVVVILPPWLNGPEPVRPGPAFLVPPRRMAKRQEATAGPQYQDYWFTSWPPAGTEVSRLPQREKDNFIKLASWWQDVIKTYNGYQRKKRSVGR